MNFVLGVGLYLRDSQLPAYFGVIDRHAFLMLQVGKVPFRSSGKFGGGMLIFNFVLDEDLAGALEV